MDNLGERKGVSHLLFVLFLSFFFCVSCCSQSRPHYYSLRHFVNLRLSLCVVQDIFLQDLSKLHIVKLEACFKQVLLFQKLTLLLAFATLISAFGSSFQYGYNVAVINSPALVLTLSLHIYYLCVYYL